MKSDLITIEVVVNGRAVKHYTHDGKTYIEAKAGTQYELKVRNATDARILAVVSVDGLNVVTGERATPQDIGYLVPAYGSLPIKGFRYSDEEVGAFKFVTKEGSYNAQMGEDTSNVGVIGLIAFEDLEEKNRRVQYAQMQISARRSTHGMLNMKSADPGPTKLLGQDLYNHLNSPEALSDGSRSLKGGRPGGASAGGAESYNANFSTTPCSLHDAQASAGTSSWMEKEYSQSYDEPNVRRLIDTSHERGKIARLRAERDASVSLPVKHNVGTGWGDKIQQACKHTAFTKGAQLIETVMFYSSREALIESGVIDPNPTMKLPSAFSKTYAIPPPGFIQG